MINDWTVSDAATLMKALLPSGIVINDRGEQFVKTSVKWSLLWKKNSGLRFTWKVDNPFAMKGAANRRTVVIRNWPFAHDPRGTHDQAR